jgi:hypothetical protein
MESANSSVRRDGFVAATFEEELLDLERLLLVAEALHELGVLVLPVAPMPPMEKAGHRRLGRCASPRSRSS